MQDETTLTLNSPLTDEDWDLIMDTDFDHTNTIWFNTKNGKTVTFVKVTKCKDCVYPKPVEGGNYICRGFVNFTSDPNDYCSRGLSYQELKEGKDAGRSDE